MQLAPIVLFVYNRPENTQRTLNALSENAEAKSSILYIFCDGPKENADTFQLEKIHKVRQICQAESRFKEVKIVEREKNFGLAPSIIQGVTDIVNKHGEIIVLEDDILTSRYFLKYMNDSLKLYKEEKKVISIGACNYFVSGNSNPSTFFIPIPDCLGWATWSDRWSLFELSSEKLLSALIEKNKIEKFNLYGFYNFGGMLQDQAKGKVSSWAVRWQALAYLNDMIALYPNPSVTQHIESDESTHAPGLNITPPLLSVPLQVEKLPVFVNAQIFYKMLLAYYTYFDTQYILKLKRKLRLNIFWRKNKKRIIEENNFIE